MNTVISADETLFSVAYPDIEKRTSISSMFVSAIFCLVGAGAFIASLRVVDTSSTLSMAFMTGGTILLLLAVFRFFWKSKEWVYVPTGSVAKERTCFFQENDLQALNAMLEKKDFESAHRLNPTPCGNVRMDYMLSQDKKFVAVQLFRFIPYTYEPASSVYYYTGNDAIAFARYLQKSIF